MRYVLDAVPKPRCRKPSRRLRYAPFILAASLSPALTPLALAQGALPTITPFSQCAVCHSTDGSNGTGPTLKGVSGRKSGTAAGFRYSRAMRSANIMWDETTLDRYLADPQAAIPGNIMPFSGVADGVERASIIAYLTALR
jgi:cytochrome c